MLDFLQQLARKAGPLRHLALVGGGFFLILTVAIALTSESAADDRYLLPSIVGLLWSLSIWAFVSTFRSIPQKLAPTLGWIGRLRTGVRRAWYWVLGLACVLGTAAAVWLSIRLLSLWLKGGQ